MYETLSIRQLNILQYTYNKAKVLTKDLSEKDLVIDPVKVIRKLGFDVTVKYDTFEMEKGFVVNKENKYLIVINENYRNKEFVLAHEVAHIYLGHFKPQYSKETNAVLDFYADIFAYELKMPEHIIRRHMDEDIKMTTGTFGVSTEIMRNRIEQLKIYSILRNWHKYEYALEK